MNLDNGLSFEMNLDNGPPKARRLYCDWQREHGETFLMKNYFVDNPTYDKVIFRRRFRMQKPLFLRIVKAITMNDVYFQQRPNATGRQCVSPLQKFTEVMRVSAYGTSTDAQDEYLRMSGTVTRDSLIHFVRSKRHLKNRRLWRINNHPDKEEDMGEVDRLSALSFLSRFDINRR
ncbi:hypothetical protein LXL04_028625 [Taraxacum kok-saghyz]